MPVAKPLANVIRPSLKLIKALDLKHLPVTQRLSNTHLVAGGLNIIFGASGAFKSFYALGLAMEIAQTEGVIYVAAEGSGGLSARVEAWCAHYGLSPGHLSFLCQELNLLDKDAVEMLTEAIKKESHKTGLVIFDTYARCMPGGDENSAKDTGIAIKHCAQIQRELSSAVLLIHHTNRAERGERGSGAMRGGADSMIEVSHQDGTIRVECSKIKDWEPWQPEHYRFKQIGTSGLLLPSDQVQQTVQLGQRAIKVLEFLSLAVFEECGAQARQICNGLNMPESSIYRLLSELKNNSQIHQDKKGDPYSLTKSGRAALQGQLSIKQPSANSSEDKDLSDDLSGLSITIN